MSWGEGLRVETPEQIDFDLEVAGPGSRFYAQVLDWAIKWLVVAVLGVAVVPVAAAAGRLSPGAAFLLLAAGVAGAFLFFLGYDVFFEGCRNGQTPGKRAAGLRVVRDDGGPVDVRAACVRNLIGVADFLPAFYLGGGLVAALNARGQRLGDMAAGTVVVRERAGEAADDLEPRILAVAGGEFAFGPEHLTHCTAGDLHLLYSFFARAERMDQGANGQLADRLCQTFLRRTGYRPATPVAGTSRTYALLASLYRDLKTLRRHS